MRKLVLIALSSFICTASALAADYAVDPDHSSIGFKVRHLGISSVAGRFTTVQGTFTFDPKNVAASKAQATVEAKSITTQQAKRDDHLRSPDFLDANSFPEIKFVSKEIKEVSGNKFKVIGDLTIRGKSNPVVLDAVFNGATKDPWGNERAAFEAEATINRKDWGLTWNKILETGGLVVGEDVKIVLEVEGVQKKA